MRSIDADWEEDIHFFDNGGFLVDVYFGRKKYSFSLPDSWNYTYYYFMRPPNSVESYSGLVFACGFNGHRDIIVQLKLKKSKPVSLHSRHGTSYLFNWYQNGDLIRAISTDIKDAFNYQKYIDEFEEVCLDYE